MSRQSGQKLSSLTSIIKLNDPNYKAIGALLGIKSLNNQSEINRIEAIARQAGSSKIDSSNDVANVRRFLNPPAPAPAAPAPASFVPVPEAAQPRPVENFEGNPDDIYNPAETVIKSRVTPKYRWLAGFEKGFTPELPTPEQGKDYVDLMPNEIESIDRNIARSFDLYKEKTLTNLRGRISNELARQAGSDSYRSDLTRSYSGILASM